MNKTALLLLTALCFSYTGNVFADADMFRSIEHFELYSKGVLQVTRHHTYIPSEASDCGGPDCRHPCVKAAERYLNPKFNGEPVVAEQPY